MWYIFVLLWQPWLSIQFLFFSPAPKCWCHLRTCLAILLSLFSFLANSSILTRSFNYKFCNANSQIFHFPYTLPRHCNTFPASSGTSLTFHDLKEPSVPFCSPTVKRKFVLSGVFLMQGQRNDQGTKLTSVLITIQLHYYRISVGKNLFKSSHVNSKVIEGIVIAQTPIALFGQWKVIDYKIRCPGFKYKHKEFGWSLKRKKPKKLELHITGLWSNGMSRNMQSNLS